MGIGACYNCSSHVRYYQLIGNLICHGANDHKRIALTFDDAPSERTSDAVLAVLAEKNVKASFFMIGENMARHPQAEVPRCYHVQLHFSRTTPTLHSHG